MLTTWLTERFGLRVPVIGAPMAGPGEGRLAAAVSAAGGLGMVGAGASRPGSWVRDQMEVAAAAGDPVGVGLMAWGLDRARAGGPEGGAAEDQLATIIGLRPALVSVSFGDVEPHVRRLREAGIAVTAQAGNVADARRAEQAGVDFLVARGAEAGGHGRDEVATLPLLQAVLEAVDVPVVAAGGIATARGLAAVLAAGAAGAWVGTALLACHEAANTPAARARLLAAGHADTAYSRVFDVAQGLAWPPEYGGRSLRNSFVDTWRDRLDELADDDDATALLAAAVADEDYDTACLYAGQGVGSLTAERPAAEVIAELAGAEALL